MGTRSEFESHIYSNWKDKKVARWVVERLPLLDKAFSRPACPIFTLSTWGDLDQIDGRPFPNFKCTLKLVMSGGFEGTFAHLEAAKEMRDAKALSMPEGSLCTFLLEPDSYIIAEKGRDPIFNLQERAVLWSTSGFLDAIVLLPPKLPETKVEEHYLSVHRALAPAGWCSNPENPNYFEIVTRMREQEPFQLIRLFKNRPEIHSSFLVSTRELEARRVRELLRSYVTDLVRKPSIYAVARFSSDDELAEIARMEYKRLAKGL